MARIDHPATAALLLSCILAVAAVPARAAEVGPPKAPMVAKTSDGMSCDSPDQSQAGLNECANLGARDADAELNDVYRKILSANAGDPVFVEKMKTAQRAWLAFRDAQLAARYPHPEDSGSVLPMCEGNELEALTRERTKQLRSWLSGVEEGDVCTGSYPISAGH
ncbi:DUF1311 domain-containing protein [Lysobacter sp. S4-A87]|uniref:lysozyme inhibitor LprI family protein n=1 Tax=Lysobacter sp. S4-A87 TaxID=2925843 RepID=UPI001F538D56|nr:lysozyme inhibitor LprI family protein [Lysobacter sp. S4-A87]UNK50812.1 DUF1311 domain-containing protein [Lysobacter sp. S4-A87]